MQEPLSFAPTVLPPEPLTAAEFVLEPLGPQHCDSDYAAWTSSMEHIRSTPGFVPESSQGDGWPRPMSIEQNRGDLVNHADEFERGIAYAYTILDPETSEVIGCTYIDPDEILCDGTSASVTCWVRSDRAHLDETVAAAIREWLQTSWRLSSVTFPGRD